MEFCIIDSLPSILMPLFSILISGGGDFLAEGSFLGTSKCEGMLLLLWLVGRLAWANSCFTTTGGNTVLLVITFFDVEGTVDGALPGKVMQNSVLKNAANLKNSEIIKFGEIDKTSGYSITITQLRHRAFHPYLAKILSSLTSPLIMQVVLILSTLF